MVTISSLKTPPAFAPVTAEAHFQRMGVSPNPRPKSQKAKQERDIKRKSSIIEEEENENEEGDDGDSERPTMLSERQTVSDTPPAFATSTSMDRTSEQSLQQHLPQRNANPDLFPAVDFSGVWRRSKAVNFEAFVGWLID